MLTQLHHFPTWALVLGFTANALIVFGLNMALMGWLRRRYPDVSRVMPVAPSFVAITTLFSLVFSLQTVEVWRHRDQSIETFRTAQMHYKRLGSLLGPQELNLPQARYLFLVYFELLVDEEWRQRNSMRSPAVDAALADLAREVTRVTPSLPGPAASHLQSVISDISRLRETKASLSAHAMNGPAWLTVALLFLVSTVSLTLVHIDRPPAAKLLLTVFLIATSFCFLHVTILQDPFRGFEVHKTNTWPGYVFKQSP